MIVYIRNVCVSFFSSHALFSSLSHSCLSLSCVCVYSQFHCFQCCLLLFLSVGFFFSFPLLLPLVATRLNGRFIGCCSRLVAAFSWFQTFYFVRSLSLSFCVRVFIGFDFFLFSKWFNWGESMLHEIFLMHFTFSFERQKNLLHQSHTEFGILICRAVVQNARLALINAMYRNLCLRISFGCWYVSWIDYDWRSQRASAHNLWWLHTSSILPSPPPYHQNPWIFSALHDKIYEELQNQQHWYVYFSMTVLRTRSHFDQTDFFFKKQIMLFCA